MLTPPPEHLSATRESLRALACYVISPARKRRTGRIGLRPTGDGFGTPPFDDGTRIVVRGNRLIVEADDSERSVAITTLRAAAAFLDLQLSADPGVGHDLPLYQPDVDLDVDEPSSQWLGRWYAFGAGQLDRLRANVEGATVSEAQLWPEHFDLAVTLDADGDAVNVGFSPGDRDTAEPYVYVGPHDRAGLDGDYWNAPFGALLPYTDLQRASDPGSLAAAFVDEGLRLVGTRPRPRSS
jgi:hypothetical protein